MQQTIFDQAERAKQIGIDVSYHNSDPVWKKAAAKRMLQLAQTNDQFTSDDILMFLEKKGIVTGNNKAVAAILQAGARAGIIRSSEIFVRCKRPQRHGAPIMVWKSNIRSLHAAS